MKTLMICMLLVFGIAGLSSATAGDKCTKTKTLTITLPDDETKEPEADPDILCVKKNSNLDVVVVAADENAKVRLVFRHGNTPLGNGNTVEKVTKKDGKKLKIRNSCGGCDFEYEVHDATKDSQRPPLDPVIIIER